MKKILAALVLCGLAGCASRASDVAASYVSTAPYMNMTCSQLAAEAQAVSAHAVASTGKQNKQASTDAAITTVGVIIFWPALFFTHGDGAQTAELARLKGEMQAIQTASRRKSCKIKFAQT